jgi:Tetratricopeptide repeat
MSLLVPRALLPVIAVLAGLAMPVVAQTPAPTMPEAAKEIMRLYGERKGPEAVKLAEDVLKATEAKYGPDHAEVANILVILGGMRMNQSLIERAIDIREKSFGKENPLVAEALVLLVKVRGFGPDSEGLLLRALKIMETTRGPEHADVARVLTMLHGLYLSGGAMADAKTTADRLEAIAAKAKPKQ